MRVGALACIGALLTGVGVLPVAGQPPTIHAACRDGTVHGEWRIVAPNGNARAIGAFAKGKRTGSFIFWNAKGVRVAHVPYDEGLKQGTLALWHEDGARSATGVQRLEAPYAGGALNGVKRSWARDGRLRGEYRYEAGRLIEASAWDARGRALPPESARRQAEADFASDEAYYARLDNLVESNLPRCATNGSRAP